MNARKVKQWIAENNTVAIENAWLEAMEQQSSTAQLRPMAEALKAMVSAKLGDTAETLGWMLLSQSMEQRPADAALEVARVILPALPGNQELRDSAADLYRKVHGQANHFDDFLQVSGLKGNQSLRRAIRTIDTCLAIRDGTYLANRFDERVVRVNRFNAALGCFELISPGGQESELEPKLLADEFECLDENDFRVLCRFRPRELDEWLASDPAAVLIGVCMAHGGRIASPALKEMLVPKHVESGKWSGWWNRARTAVRKSQSLSLEGRNPIAVSYHPQGRSLEEELAAAVDEATGPLDHLAILRQYARQLKHGKLAIDPGFVGPIMAGLAEHAESLGRARAAEAFATSLVIDTAVRLGMPAPQGAYPTAVALLAEAANPAQTVAQLTEPSLWPAALNALAAREDATEHLEKLLALSPSNQLDEIAGRLHAAGRAEAVKQAIADALANRPQNLQICVWLWRGPAASLRRTNSLLELLSCLLNIMQELSRDWDTDRKTQRAAFQQIRSALAAGKYRTFTLAVEEMDEEIAETIKLRIERSDGLNDVVREQLLAILREKHHKLFLTEKADPWVDETIIWTTQESLHRREAELKELMEVKVPANSRAIGVAAAHGDLSENSEWQSAIEEQRRLNDRAIMMKNELNRARILQPEDVPVDSVGIGSIVALGRGANGEEIELTFLGPWDSNVEKSIYNYKAPLAQALMGKAVGETATLKIQGAEDQYTIRRIGSALGSV